MMWKAYGPRLGSRAKCEVSMMRFRGKWRSDWRWGSWHTAAEKRLGSIIRPNRKLFCPRSGCNIGFAFGLGSHIQSRHTRIRRSKPDTRKACLQGLHYAPPTRTQLQSKACNTNARERFNPSCKPHHYYQLQATLSPWSPRIGGH